MRGQRYVGGAEILTKRVFRFTLGACIIFFVLLTRIWYLQIIQSDKLKGLSESNRLRLVPVAAPRGAILDRNGEVLVSNAPSFSVAVVPQDVKDKERLVATLTSHLHIGRDELLERWEKGRRRAKYFPVILASGISRDQLEFLEENKLWLPGLDIEVKPIRHYSEGLLAAHLLGHLGEITEQEMADDRFSDYNLGDYVGKSGIERNWEQDLHGVNGGRQIEVDARGRFLRTLSESRPATGDSVVLTIDSRVQKAAEQAFGDRAGAAVVMDIRNGEILAFVSNPAFDPALFSGRMPPEVWKAYLQDKRRPLENKALTGQYPPGSTFKIITALAALEAGVINAGTTFDCNGSHAFGNRTFKCWNRRGHGTVNLKKALRESCDVYFYHLAEQLGVDRIARSARKFGLGEAMGVGLENEKSGLIPTAEWKEKKYKTKWYSGETLPVAIGQGFVLATPIQLASMMATVANEGTVYRPHLVRRVVDPDGKVLRETTPEVIKTVDDTPERFRLVKEGLLAVVNEPGGTGGAARLAEVKVAGKTGTSQVVKLRDNRGAIPYEHRDHALFVAFAPFERPEVAVAVVVEHGEHGGGTAAPIAGRILRAYFEGTGVIKPPVKSGSGSSEEEGGAVPAEGEQQQKQEPVPGD